LTKSLHVALVDLKLQQAWIVHPGSQRYPVHPKVEVVPLVELPDRLAFMGRPAKVRKERRGKALGR